MLPRTSRWRGGFSFVEKWTNSRAAMLGFFIGRGYSSAAVAEMISDDEGKVSDATVRCMAKKWGLPLWGKRSDCYLVIPIKERERATIHARAQQEGLGDEEYCRRFIVAGTVERATYGKVVRQDQFEDVT